MEELKKKILDFVNENGPVLPIQISKNIGGNTIFAGAFLSELVHNKQIFITKAKVGNSPMYYVQGQEEKLEMLREHLSERPKKAFDLLKENKILRDKFCEPWERVALREIKDFALPLNVNLKGNVEVFWKWYLLTDEEAREIILSMIKDELEKKEEPKKVEEVEDVKEEKQEAIKEIEKPKEEKQEELIKQSFEKLENQGEFYEEIVNFFDNKEIEVIEQKVKNKKREIHFVAKIPSAVGHLKYLVIARNKKKLNDGDLSLAYQEGSDMKMPVLVLGTGVLTKKAEKYIEEKIKGLVFQKL